MNYINFHSHSHYSNVSTPDVIIKNKDRVNRVVELNQGVVSGIEHGTLGNYFEVMELAKENNIKPLFGTEAYFVIDRFEKDATNSHLIMLAKNENGRKNINRIISEANVSGYYYKPRTDLSLVLSLPKDDVWITSACVGGIWKYGEEKSLELFEKLLNHFGENLFLEVQYHHKDSQKELNSRILSMSKEYNCKIIAGMDTHMITMSQSTERDIYLQSRGIQYPDEEGWFLDFPDYNTAVSRFKEQGVLTKEETYSAMNNTNIFNNVQVYDSVIFDKNKIKLPTLYPGKTQREKNEIFSDLIWNEWDKEKKNVPVERWDEYVEEIKKEEDTVLTTNISDYFLLDYEIIKKGVENGGQITFTGRGSAPSYYISKLLGLTTIDRISAEVKLFPERFISKERLLKTHSIPDIDINLGTVEIFEKAQEEILGKGHSYRMLAYGTVGTSNAWKLYARYAGIDFETSNLVSEQIKQYEEDLKYADELEQGEEELSIHDYVEEKYWTMIEESKKFLKVVYSLTQHACGFLLFDDGLIEEEIGLIRAKDTICVAIDGKSAEKYLFMKNDLLKVSVVKLIHETYKRIGMKPDTFTEIIEKTRNDQSVWDIYAKGCTVAVNQFETEKTTKKAMKYIPKNISELSSFIAAIRPGFKSLYSQYEKREPFSYGIKSIDNLIQTKQFPYSYLLYQENAMAVLAYADIAISETYEIIKAIAKKRHNDVIKYKEIFIPNMTKKLINVEKISNKRAKDISEGVWKVIEDSANYSFNACISGDTRIQKAGSSNGRFYPTVEEMFYIKNSFDYAKETGHLDLHRKYKWNGYGNALSMCEDGRVRKNNIINIYQSGIRKTYKVTVSSGSYLICTDNHKFPTPIGEKKLMQLRIGDNLYVKGEYEKNKKNHDFTNGNYIDNFPKKGQKGFQENENGPTVLFNNFRNQKVLSNSACEVCGNEYKKDKKFELHHKDIDESNNNPSNLLWCCNSCHKKEHYKLNRNKVFDKGIPTFIDAIVSIEYVMEEMTYDIEMDDPNHNFISESGLITSNSHSLSVAGDSVYCAYLKAHYPVQFYETLLRIDEEDGKKDKIELAKIEAQSFFKINFPDFKFGMDNRDINGNTETKEIMMSLKTLKGFGESVAENMYNLYNDFQKEEGKKTFFELMLFAESKGMINKKFKELILLNYFSDFGNNRMLMMFFEEFTSGKNRYSSKLTDKTKQKRLVELDNFWSFLPEQPFTTYEQIQNEISVIGKPYSKYESISKMYAFVQEINTKSYHPILKLHILKTGEVKEVKVNQNLYYEHHFKEGDILLVKDMKKKFRKTKDDDGKWKNSEVSDWYMDSWYKMCEIDEFLV